MKITNPNYAKDKSFSGKIKEIIFNFKIDTFEKKKKTLHHHLIQNQEIEEKDSFESLDWNNLLSILQKDSGIELNKIYLVEYEDGQSYQKQTFNPIKAYNWFKDYKNDSSTWGMKSLRSRFNFGRKPETVEEKINYYDPKFIINPDSKIYDQEIPPLLFKRFLRSIKEKDNKAEQWIEEIKSSMYDSETIYLDGKKEMIWYDQHPSNEQPYLEFDN